MPTCQPPVVALLGSGSCLRLVPAAQDCPPAYLPGNPMYAPVAPPIPGHGARPHLFQELWRWGISHTSSQLVASILTLPATHPNTWTLNH